MIASTSVEESRLQDRPADAAKSGAKNRGRCFLISPSGQRGGGMGRISDYLMQAARADARMPNYVAVDCRGPGHVLWSPLYLLLAMARLAVGAIRQDVALVHFNVAERGSIWRKGVLVLYARALRLPIVLHLHAAELLQYHARLRKPFRNLVSTIFRSADCCIVLGELWRRFVIEELGVDAGKVVILHNGVPRAAFSRQPRPSDHQLRILFLGNLMERKEWAICSRRWRANRFLGRIGARRSPAAVRSSLIAARRRAWACFRGSISRAGSISAVPARCWPPQTCFASLL
jgi:hypothetical protein